MAWTTLAYAPAPARHSAKTAAHASAAPSLERAVTRILGFEFRVSALSSADRSRAGPILSQRTGCQAWGSQACTRPSRGATRPLPEIARAQTHRCKVSTFRRGQYALLW